MPKIKLDRTIQYKRKTYKLGETVEISVEDVEMLADMVYKAAYVDGFRDALYFKEL